MIKGNDQQSFFFVSAYKKAISPHYVPLEFSFFRRLLVFTKKEAQGVPPHASHIFPYFFFTLSPLIPLFIFFLKIAENCNFRHSGGCIFE